MSNLSLKTKILNSFRNIGKLSFLERFLVARTQGKTTADFFTKLAPNNYQYPPQTMRRCRRNGIEYHLDISDYMQYCIYYGIETEPRETLYGLVENATTIIDVGTNIGETLLNFAQINSTGQNIGFEPVPFLFEQASRNIAENRFDNIILENCALSDSDSTLYFNIGNEFNSGGIFLSEEQEQKDDLYAVKAILLDDYVRQNELRNISLIKIDVEGFEMKVLQGAVETVSRHRPRMFVEVNDSFLRRQGSSAVELLNYFFTRDYEVFYAEGGNAVSIDDDFEGKHFDIVAAAR